MSDFTNYDSEDFLLGEDEEGAAYIDIDELDEAEIAILAQFLEGTGGDAVQAAAMFDQYMEKMEAKTSAEAEQQAAADAEEADAWPTTEQFEEFVLQHPTVRTDPSSFIPHVQAAGGDLDAAYRTYSRGLDLKIEAAEKEGYQVGPKLTTAQALDAAFAPGGEMHNAPKPYEHTPTGYDTPLDAAAGDTMETLSRENIDKAFARAEVKRMQRGGV